MVNQPLGYYQELRSPGDRARFVHYVNLVRDAGDIKSLAVQNFTANRLTADSDNSESTGRRVGVRYVANLSGDVLPNYRADGRSFVVSVQFVYRDEPDGDSNTLILEALRVGLKTTNNSLIGDGVADITDYRYDPQIAGTGKIPMDGFPVEWRHQLADAVMALVLIKAGVVTEAGA